MFIYDLNKIGKSNLFSFIIKVGSISLFSQFLKNLVQNFSLTRDLYVLSYIFFVLILTEIPISEEYFVGAGLFLFFQINYKTISDFFANFFTNEVRVYWFSIIKQYLYLYYTTFMVRFYLVHNLLVNSLLLFYQSRVMYFTSLVSWLGATIQFPTIEAKGLIAIFLIVFDIYITIYY